MFDADQAAAFVWCSLAEGQCTGDVATELAQRAEIDPDQARDHVDRLLDDWRTHGLLAGSTVPADETGCVFAHATTPQPVLDDAQFIVICRILDIAIAVRFADSSLYDDAVSLLGRLGTPAPPDQCRILDVARLRSGVITIRSDAQEFYRGRRNDCIASAVLAALIQMALTYSAYYPAIHAGLVAGPGGAALLPAPSGYGKSTLVAGLWVAGLSALSDDTVVLDMRDMTARPANPYVCLKSGSWAVLRSRIPDLARSPRFRRPDGHNVRYLLPGEARPWDHSPTATEGVAVRTIIFGRHGRREPTRLSPLSTAEALTHLFPCVDPIGHRFTPFDIDQLIDWIDGTERYALVYGDLDEAIAAVRNVATG